MKTTRLMMIALLGLALGGCSGGSGSMPSYTISTSAGTGGTISPISVTVKKNKTTSFTVTPDTGYAISSVSGCGGSLSGTTFTTGAITADCTVTASFIATHTVGSQGTDQNEAALNILLPQSPSVNRLFTYARFPLIARLYRAEKI